MKLQRTGRIITIEIEDSDLLSDVGLDEEMQVDAIFSGMKFAASHYAVAASLSQKLQDMFPAEAQELRDDFRERWELP